MVAHDESDRDAEARLALDATIARYGENGAYRIALVYAWWGDADDAVTWLERGQERRSARVALEIALHPFYARLRDHPRYVRLLRKMNLPATGP